MKKFSTIFLLYFCILKISSSLGSLPNGFVYLSDVDPTILQHAFYYGTHNFMGHKIDGYKAPKIILTEKAALALKKVQDELRKDNYTLIVTDAYRPQKAVDHFVRWSRNISDQKLKQYYYPNIDKRDAFKLEYVAERSGHTRGSTVDLTIIQIGKTYNPNPPAIERKLTNGQTIYRWDDNTMDMYTSVDLMDPASWPNTTLIEAPYMKNRNYLRAKMEAQNFKQYHTEWWHFTLNNEPFNNTYFDFDVE